MFHVVSFNFKIFSFVVLQFYLRYRHFCPIEKIVGEESDRKSVKRRMQSQNKIGQKGKSDWCGVIVLNYRTNRVLGSRNGVYFSPERHRIEFPKNVFLKNIV